MTSQSKPPCLRVLALFGVVVSLLYSNTLDVPWHFDDFENIVNNRKLHITAPTTDSLSAFIGDVWIQEWLKRPLSYTSFALNWFFGQNQPAGYHVVNTAIHWFSAVFLYLASIRLFQSPRLAGIYNQQQIHCACLIAALLWAVNPIQTQAVTYIVQRMASLSGMFFILSVWLFLNGRLSAYGRAKTGWFLGCAASAAAAFFSKENAATLPFALLLIEAIFFRDLRNKKAIIFIAAALIGIALISLWLSGQLFFGGVLSNVLNYGDRHFSAWERLLSQPRALVLYLSVIIYPSPLRLSVTHDFEVSGSLLSPWTTGACLLIIICLVAVSLWRMRQWPLLSFALLFFFVNHLVESTIIGLELVFEHRNYIPSMFLFLPAAVALMSGFDYFRHRSRTVYRALWVFVVLVIAGFGSGTYVRNLAWSTPLMLWEDALTKAPGESRPYQMLAVHHYDRIGDQEMSLRLYKEALVKRKNRISDKAVILNNMGAIYYQRRDFGRAAELWKQAAEAYSGYQFLRYHYAEALLRNGQADEALLELDQIIEKRPDRNGPLAMKGMILIRQGKLIEGIDYLRRAIKAGAMDHALMINLGAGFHLLGQYQQANVFFHEAHRKAPADRMALLWLAKNHMRKGSLVEADAHLAKLIGLGPLKDLTSWLRSVALSGYREDGLIAPELDDELMGRLAAIVAEPDSLLAASNSQIGQVAFQVK